MRYSKDINLLLYKKMRYLRNSDNLTNVLYLELECLRLGGKNLCLRIRGPLLGIQQSCSHFFLHLAVLAQQYLFYYFSPLTWWTENLDRMTRGSFLPFVIGFRIKYKKIPCDKSNIQKSSL